MDLQTTLTISLAIAVAATALVLAGGMPLALALARPRWRPRLLVDVLVNLPLALPPTVLGYYLLRLIGRTGPIGQLTMRLWGGTLVFTPAAAVLAEAVVSLPLFVQAARNALERVPAEIHEAAAIDGVGPWAHFRYITAPLAWPGIWTGVLLAYARCLGEFGATLMVAGNIPGRTQTMALAVYSAVQAGHDSAANRLALILTAVATISIWAGLRWRQPSRWQERSEEGAR